MRLVLKRRKTQAGLKDRAEFERILKNVEDGTDRIRRITHQLLGYVGKNNSAAAQVDPESIWSGTLFPLFREWLSKKNIKIDNRKWGRMFSMSAVTLTSCARFW